MKINSIPLNFKGALIVPRHITKENCPDLDFCDLIRPNGRCNIFLFRPENRAQRSAAEDLLEKGENFVQVVSTSNVISSVFGEKITQLSEKACALNLIG